MLAYKGIVYLALYDIGQPKFARHFTEFNPAGLPYFYGIACYTFEGTPRTLEHYYAMKNREKDFTKALGTAIGICCYLQQFISIIVYHAYAQFTQP
jgi:hypothetical protein